MTLYKVYNSNIYIFNGDTPEAFFDMCDLAIIYCVLLF
jgi:hypothetical protein